MRVEAGSTFDERAGGAGELWYVATGRARLTTARGETELAPCSATLVHPGPYRVVAGEEGDVELVATVLPAEASGVPDRAIAVRLDECEPEVTGDREFRVLIGPDLGCEAATQFVGDIPPGRAPVHEHTYDEVVFVLAGSGVVHLADGDRPIRPGTCVYLPPGSPHCLENTGSDVMRVLGVFHPGGSPAAKKEHSA